MKTGEGRLTKKVGKDVSFRDAAALARRNAEIGRKLSSLGDKIAEYENDPVSKEAIQKLIENADEIKYRALKSQKPRVQLELKNGDDPEDINNKP